MSYSPKHKGTHASDNTPASASGDKKKTKIIVIVVVAVLAVIAAIALIFILWPNNPIGNIFTGGSSADGGNNSIETQSETTNISIYYEDGIVPTTGSVHGVTIIEGGGANARDFEGRWNLDDNTYFQFDGQGKGFIHAANDMEHFHFRYSAQDGVLAIDMDRDSATDKEYQYVLDGDNLTLTNSDNQVYKLTRVGE